MAADFKFAGAVVVQMALLKIDWQHIVFGYIVEDHTHIYICMYMYCHRVSYSGICTGISVGLLDNNIPIILVSLLKMWIY